VAIIAVLPAKAIKTAATPAIYKIQIVGPGLIQPIGIVRGRQRAPILYIVIIPRQITLIDILR
jgi:hypothetical protein